MFLNPPLLALILSSLATALVVLWGAVAGFTVLRGWDGGSGSEEQVRREGKAALLGTTVGLALTVEAVSLFFLVAVADRLHPLLEGAMCAAGVLNANPLGSWALAAKGTTSFLSALWLLLDRLDSRGTGRPLLGVKTWLLAALALLLAAGWALLLGFAAGLKPDIVTTCCGTLFDETPGPGGSPFLFPLPGPDLLFAGTALVLGAGLYVLRTGKGAVLFSLAGLGQSALGLLSLLSFIGPAIYWLKGHHCPYCVLLPEYGFVGYPFYLALFVGAVSSAGVGAAGLFRGRDALREAVGPFQRRLVWWALGALSLFALGAALALWKSPLRF